jgi:hypothetical protein
MGYGSLKLKDESLKQLSAEGFLECLIAGDEACSLSVVFCHCNYFHFIFRQANKDGSVFLIQTE